jgi:hypothetical protein
LGPQSVKNFQLGVLSQKVFWKWTFSKKIHDKHDFLEEKYEGKIALEEVKIQKYLGIWLQKTFE